MGACFALLLGFALSVNSVTTPRPVLREAANDVAKLKKALAAKKAKKESVKEMKEYGVDGERERAAKGERFDRSGKIVNKIKARKSKSGGTDTGKKADDVEVK